MTIYFCKDNYIEMTGEAVTQALLLLPHTLLNLSR